MIEFANSQCVMQRLALRLYSAKVKTIQLFRHKKNDKTSTLLIYFIIPPPDFDNSRKQNGHDYRAVRFQQTFSRHGRVFKRA